MIAINSFISSWGFYTTWPRVILNALQLHRKRSRLQVSLPYSHGFPWLPYLPFADILFLFGAFLDFLYASYICMGFADTKIKTEICIRFSTFLRSDNILTQHKCSAMFLFSWGDLQLLNNPHTVIFTFFELLFLKRLFYAYSYMISSIPALSCMVSSILF